MTTYLGIKRVEAEPMTLLEYEDYNAKKGNWTTSDVKPDVEGYLIKYKDDYESWMPKDVFEKDYKEIDNTKIPILTISEPNSLTDFADAIRYLKEGYKVAREGWNGKGMFVYYVPANKYKTQTYIAIKEFGEYADYNPYLAIKTAQGSLSTWVPSINDVLANDWRVYDNN